MVRPGVEGLLGGKRGGGPLAAEGEPTRKRRAQMGGGGVRREMVEEREGDQNDRGENLNPFYSFAFRRE